MNSGIGIAKNNSEVRTDQLKLDFKWLDLTEKDERTLGEMIAQIKDEAASIQSAVEELEKLIGEVNE